MSADLLNSNLKRPLSIWWCKHWKAPVKCPFLRGIPQFTTILPSCQAMKTTAKSEKKNTKQRDQKKHPKKWEIMGHPFEKNKLQAPPDSTQAANACSWGRRRTLCSPHATNCASSPRGQKASVVGGKLIYFIERDWTEDVKSCQVKFHQRVLVVECHTQMCWLVLYPNLTGGCLCVYIYIYIHTYIQ